MNTQDTGLMVELALSGGYGLWVELDAGDVDLFGSDLSEEWENLSPGETFNVLGIIIEKESESP